MGFYLFECSLGEDPKMVGPLKVKANDVVEDSYVLDLPFLGQLYLVKQLLLIKAVGEYCMWGGSEEDVVLEGGKL